MTEHPHKPAQLTDADVKRLYAQRKYAEIDRAREDGRLDDMLGQTRHWPPTEGQWAAEDLAAMVREGRHHEIDQARAAGQMNDLMAGVDPDVA